MQHQLKKKCLLWYCKVLSASMALLGVVSCASSRRGMKEVVVPPETHRHFEDIRVMYGVPTVTPLDKVEVEGDSITIEKK